MNKDEAKIFLRAYPCVCDYGKSPTNCNDDICPFRQAILLLTEDEVIICRPEGKGDDSSLDRVLHPNDTHLFC